MQRVAYTDPQKLIDRFSKDLKKQFPLTNIHWSPGDRPLRTIPCLNISLVPQDNKKQHQILGLSDAPLIQVYFFEADSYDAYKSSRKQIQEWAKQVQAIRDPTGYLIVHFVDHKKHRSKSTWTKLHNEYGDHAAQIYLDTQTELERTEMWARFCQSLKDEVLTAFSNRVHAFEGEIRNLQSTRDIVGWNFGRLFVIKESLATCFEDMGFLEEAYQIYIELERMAEPDFFSDTTSVDLSIEVERSHVLDIMLTQTASRFDFYSYLFNREVALLVAIASGSSLPSVQDKHLGLTVQRALNWVPKLIQLLEKSKCDPVQILDWQMRTASYVYNLVAQHSSNTIADSRGQLLLLRRDALTSMASSRGFIIKGVPTSVPLQSFEAEYPTSQESFEEEFFQITQEAVKDFKMTGMERSAASLTVQLANIDFNRGQYEKAFNELELLKRVYQDSKWNELAANVYHVYSECAEKLGKNEKVVEAAWALLSLQPNLSSKVSETCIKHIENHKSSAPMVMQASKWLKVDVCPYLCGDTRYYVKVTIKNKYPLLPFLKMQQGVLNGMFDDKRGQTRKITFTCQSIGEECLFYTNQFIEGTIFIKELALTQGQQTLIETFSGISIRMVQLTSCINAQLKLAKQFTHTKRNLELVINSPEPISARVKIQAVDGLQILHEKLESSSLENFICAELNVPALVRLAQPLARVLVVIEYGKSGRFEFTKQVDMSFSVLVHVQEFFRESMILNQFLISCTTTMPVIVEQALLERSKRFAVTNAEVNDCHVVLDGAPVSLLYMLEPDDAKGADNLTLNLSYRPVEWECNKIIWEQVVTKLAPELRKWDIVIKDALSNLYVDSVSYVIQSRFQIDPDEIERLLEAELKFIEPRTRSLIHSAIKDALADEMLKGDREFSSLNACMELLSPEPAIDIVHFVNLDYERKSDYTIGEIIKAKLRIKSISKWASKPIPESTRFIFELDKFNCEGWLFHGTTKAEFENYLETEISLIPTKAGKLDMVQVEIFSNERLNQEIVQRQKGEVVIVLPESNELTLTF